MPAIHSPRASTAPYADQSNAQEILTCTGCFAGLALVAVLMRLYVRQFMTKNKGADDLCIVLAMLMGCAIYACFVMETFHGVGEHASTVSSASKTTFLKISFAHEMFQICGMGLARISIALLLLRFVTRRGYRRFLWAMIAFLATYGIVCLLIAIFSCGTSVSDLWVPGKQVTRCLPTATYRGLLIANSTISIASDIILSLLPIPIISNMTLSRRARTALSVVLGLGLLAVIASALKVQAQATVLTNPDHLFHDRYSTMAAIELYLGILAASIPGLKPLLVAFLASARNLTSLNSIHEVERKTTQPPAYNTLDRSGSRPINTTSRTSSGNSVFNQAFYDTSAAPPPAAVAPARYSAIEFLTVHNPACEVKTQCRGAKEGDDVGREADKCKTGIVRTTSVLTLSEPMTPLELVAMSEREGQRLSVVEKRWSDWPFPRSG